MSINQGNEQQPKRGRGRPRKYPKPEIVELSTETNIPELPIISPVELEVKSEADLESELKSLMEGDAIQTGLENYNLVYVPPDCTFDSLDIDQPTGTGFEPERSDPTIQTGLNKKSKSKRPNKFETVKPMTKTSKKLLKFGYTGILRMADTVTKGKIPGERAVMILQNDKQSDELLNEILAELDEVYHIEKYLNPESKLGLFTLQLLYTAKQQDSSSSSS